MRIISGILKGRKILEPTDKHTRPLKDLTKESLFNLISHSKNFDFKMKSAKVLDIFAGTGSFGLECISRGASSVVFIENYSNALRILNKNISNINLEKNSNVLAVDLFETNVLELLNVKFDLIFLDPPYKEQRIFDLFKKIELSNVIQKNTLVVVHRHKKDKNEIPKSFKKIEDRTYGISRIIFYSLT